MLKKDHPILFSKLLVVALLADRKSMTRRVNGLEEINKNPEYYSFVRIGEIEGKGYGALFVHKETDEEIFVKSQFGRPGDFLWVRENTHVDEHMTWMYSADDAKINYSFRESGDYSNRYFREKRPGTISCIHMPRFVSRFTLLVKGMAIERLHDITTEDIIREGLTTPLIGNDAGVHLKHQWSNLWMSINDKDSWDKNPWLWVVEFEQIKRS